MTESVKDWRQLSPAAKAILEAAANLYYGGDMDAAYRVGVARARSVEVLPLYSDESSQVQLRLKRPKPPQ